MTDQSSSCRTLLAPTRPLHKERAEHTQILMSPTRPIRLQLQRLVSGLLYKDLWVHFLNTLERLFIFHQVRVIRHHVWVVDSKKYCQRVMADTMGRFSMNISRVKTLELFLVRITSVLRQFLLATGGIIP